MFKVIKIFFLFFLFTVNSLIGFTSVIQGDGKSFKGEIVKLKIYSNPISRVLEEISRDTIDASGTFELKADIKEVTYATILIKNIYFSIYLEPNSTYKVLIPSKSEVLDGDPEVRLKAFLPIELYANIINQDSNSLNYKIASFNEFYNDFLIKNKKDLINTRNKKLIESFKAIIDKNYSNVKFEYLKNLIQYRIASLEMMEQLHSSKGAINIYFNKKPILYNNDEYIEFFHNFFEKYLLKLSKGKSRDTIISAINKEKSYVSLIKIMANDSTLLMNDTLREFVMIKGLQEIYGYSDFKKEGIIEILMFISKNSNVEIHKKIAASIIKELTYLQPGSKAPEFKVVDLNNNTRTLSSYKGKMVYINFFACWNVKSIEELKAIDTIQKKYGDKVEFVNISTDDSLNEIKDAISNYKIKQNIYHFGIDKDIIDLYNIKSIPSSVLIDEFGNIIACPALKPSENMLGYLNKLFDARDLENLRKLEELKSKKLKDKVDDINNNR
ncbi:MAG: TlpA disulfide reductase family protein [Bacteroidota bacterium]